MNRRELDWLKLHIAVPSSVKLCSLIEYFGSPAALMEADEKRLLTEAKLSEKTVQAIKNADEGKTDDIIRICEKYGWKIITPESDFYPGRLRQIKDYPFVLFCDGNTDVLKKEPKISIVGTRTPSDKALMAVYNLACCLASLGCVTVSGGALGIDSASHEGALTGSLTTATVLGTGLGSDYLPVNRYLRKRIENNGVLISEFLPFEGPTKYSFPRRNRIISALSEVTVVAESGASGGSLITADYARKQGRTVMCFDESVVKSDGCSQLIGKGAPVFSTPGELLKRVNFTAPADEKNEKYLDFSLRNSGITGVHIIKPFGMSSDAFAAFNGISIGEANAVLGRKTSVAEKPAPIRPKNEITKKTKQKTEKTQNEASEPPKEDKITPPPDYISDSAKKVYGVLEKEPLYFDEIQYKTSLEPRDVMTAVTELELFGLAGLHPGNRVSKT